jgi:reversibly glycosylated polypeptide / UDP-arabinopyranose mutase
MAEPRVCIVVPTVREECMQQFLSAWEPEFANQELIVVEDNPERTFRLTTGAQVTHYCWRDIEAELGDRSWIVPRRTDCVRSFGYWQAWRRQPDFIVTLDDDCMPPAGGPRGFLRAHWQRLEQGGHHDAWVSTTSGTIPRGVPYQARARSQRCVVNHGLWTNVIDYDAVTQLSQVRTPTEVGFPDQTIPRGAYFPMCGMNLAWRPELTPALYFLLMGRDHGVDRFGDIWAGLLCKRICDHLGLAINSGSPTVHHARASNVWANLRKEAPGMERNETLWRLVDGTVLTATTPAGCYRQLADAFAAAAGDQDPWLHKVAQAMRHWCDLFGPVLVPTPSQRSAVGNVVTV